MPKGPRLPRSVRQSLARRLDWLLAAILAGSFILHFGFAVYLHGLDRPNAPDVEALPDHFVQVVVPHPLRIEPVPPAPRDPEDKIPTRRKAAARPTGQRKQPQATADLSRTGVLKILGARGDEGLVADVLRNGDVSADSDKVFDKIGGVEVGGDPRGLHTRDGGASHDLRRGDDLRAQGPAVVRSGDRGDERAARGSVTGSAPIDVDGGDPREIINEVRRRLGAIKACYQASLKINPQLGGKLQLRFTISAIGKVVSSSVEKDTVRDLELSRCITAKIASWRFPSASERVDITFPFVFQPAR
jgi:hypothetical protein